MRARTAPLVVAALLVTAHADAAVDTLYRAGTLAGRTFYWVPIDPIRPDTLRWTSLQACLGVGERDTAAHSVKAAAAALAAKGWALYRLDRCTAMSLALLMEQQVSLCALTQWHAALAEKVVLPRPGMPQKPMRHNLVSDYQWEEVERASVDPPTGTMQDFRTAVWFSGAGYCEFWGRDEVTRDNRQIRGTDGLGVRIDEVGYQEDANVRRRLSELYVALPADVDVKSVVATLEKAMDKRKLDLSYTAPTPVKVK